MASIPKFISNEETAYIELLLRDLDAKSRQRGLQRLCACYRTGQVLVNPNPVRVVLLGLMDDESEKVRRWALNTLALLGGPREALPILRSIDSFRASPDLLGASISALSSLLPEDQFTKALLDHDLRLEGSTLFAAVQQNQTFIPKLRKNRLNIDSASPVDLRMATILVGLNRVPFRLFSPKHNNDVMIGELNTHDDSMVAQYSIWAIVENPAFNLQQLKMPLRDIEAQPENVRGWLYRLVVSDNVSASKHMDIIQTGSHDPSVSAREGLAEGIVDTSFDGIDDIVIKWFLSETNDTVKQRLLEHMARHSSAYSRYESIVVSAYEQAPQNSLVRARLESSAQGKTVYRKLKTIDLSGARYDLFESPPGDLLPSNSTTSMIIDMKPKNAQNIPPRENVKVLIVTALPKERAAVLAAMSVHERFGVEGDPKVYDIGLFVDSQTNRNPRAVILCQSGMGNDNAATAATDALRSFPNVEHVIMTGIAGGCPNPDVPSEHVRLGDIVFSGEAGIVEYDFVKEEPNSRKTRSSPQKPSARILDVASAICADEMLGKRPWLNEIEQIIEKIPGCARPPSSMDILHAPDQTIIEHPKGAERHDQPVVHNGGIGTADTLQKNPQSRDELRDKYRVKAIEMEAGGMQNAAWAHDRSIMVVRGICDYCDTFKNDAWQNYAAAVAAAFTKILILEMPSEWFP